MASDQVNVYHQVVSYQIYNQIINDDTQCIRLINFYLSQ